MHNFIYSLKTLFKNKALIFWTFAFPIIMGIFFNMAFSNIEKNEKLSIIDIAIVNNDDFNNNEILKETFKKLSSKENEDRLFNIKYVNLNKAKELLENDEVTGYLIVKDSPKVVVKKSGINQTILKYVTEEIMQTSDMVKDLSEIEIKKGIVDYQKIYKNVLYIINNSDPKLKDTSSSNLSYTMIEFYTLIAMACLYGGILGMTSINSCLPNMSNNGKRVSVSPTSKVKMIFTSMLASYIIQIIGVALLLLFTIFVLNVDYGNNLLLIIILALVGSLAGLSLGIAIGTILKTNENAKIGIIISITMLCSFLSGMMGITMKYVIDKNVPILNIINPANMITDGFYSLYYYDTLDRYLFNLTSLIIFSCIMFVLSFTSLRRQKYDSI